MTQNFGIGPSGVRGAERVCAIRQFPGRLFGAGSPTARARRTASGSRLALILLLLGSLVGCPPGKEADEDPTSARGFSRSHRDADGNFICRDPCDLFQIAWSGDNMIGDHGKAVLKRKGLDYPIGKVKVLLEDAFAVGNAEGPITKHRKKFNKKQMWSYGTKPEVAGVFAAAGFDAMGLANNHAFDRGEIGLQDTLTHLHKAGIQTFGAGMDREQAEAPLLIETPHGTVGVVAMFRTGVVGQESGPSRPGTAWLNESTMRRAHERARAAGARWVVAYVHWGRNYQTVRRQQRQLARQLVHEGYDLVVGHGSHTPQKVELVDGVPVLYSLGNFTFTSYGRFRKLNVPQLGYGLVARTFLGPEGFEGIELRCLKTDNSVVKYQPTLCGVEETQALFARLGDRLIIRGDAAVLSLSRPAAAEKP